MVGIALSIGRFQENSESWRRDALLYAVLFFYTTAHVRVLKNYAMERIGTLLTLPALFSGQRAFP